jgi:hypothetical protein
VPAVAWSSGWVWGAVGPVPVPRPTRVCSPCPTASAALRSGFRARLSLCVDVTSVVKRLVNRLSRVCFRLFPSWRLCLLEEAEPVRDDG